MNKLTKIIACASLLAAIHPELAGAQNVTANGSGNGTAPSTGSNQAIYSNTAGSPTNNQAIYGSGANNPNVNKSVYGTAGSNPGSRSATGVANNAASNPNTPDGNVATHAGSTISWSSQSTYWQNNYSKRPYYNGTNSYVTYEPAYKYGIDLYNRNQGKPYNELDQSQLGKGWEQSHGSSNLNWNEAQAATQDAYNRIYNNNHNDHPRPDATSPAGKNTIPEIMPPAAR
ncbi:MAG: hypothetical protein EB059_08850 [Alphaproteobacteria bacterium]|nr:hypothetical protein [Alphaproteobacteria bacterium]